MQRLGSQDASFLSIEDDKNHMHIGSVGIFEGPPPEYRDMCRMVGAKLPLVPRYRQRVKFVPLALGRPVWVDDEHFSLSYHLRHSALPHPGSEEQLRNLVGRVMSQQLDRNRPLWEMWIIEGLEQGRWALISKTHHAMVDGVSGADLLRVVLDAERDPRPVAEAEWRPEPEPAGAELVAETVARRAMSPFENVVAMGRHPRALGGHALTAVRGLAAMRGLAVPTPASSLNGPIGPHRRWAWARSSLGDVKTVRQAHGGTVNDVVLATITNGFRELLLSRGESVDRSVRTLVPVSVRAPTEKGTYNNRVSAMFASLPVGIEDPLERLAAIEEQMQHLKESNQAVAGEVLTSLSGYAPAMLLSLGIRAASALPQRNLNTVTTNVPGPRNTLYAGGRRLLEAFPYVPLAGTVRIGVAIFSYDGGLNYGVTADYDTAADVEVLSGAIESGMAELVALSAPAPKRGRAGKAVGRSRAASNGRKARAASNGGRKARTGGAST